MFSSRIRVRNPSVVVTAHTAVAAVAATAGVTGLYLAFGGYGGRIRAGWLLLTLPALALAGLALRLAVQAERRLRPGVLHTGRRPPRRPRAVAAGIAAGGLIFFAGGVFLFGYALNRYAIDDRSQFVQRNGVPRQATVLRVRNFEQHTRSGPVYSARISVTLRTAAGGRTAATVYLSHRPAVTRGQTIRVLVDPVSPSYAEIPGQPYGNGQWYYLLVVVPVGWTECGYFVRELTRTLAASRAGPSLLAGAGSPGEPQLE